MRISGARIARGLPLGDRRRLPQLVIAAPNQNPHQRRRQALGHRPAFERSLRGDAGPVTLGDQPSAPGNRQRRGEPFCGSERGVESLLQLVGIDARRDRANRRVARGPGLRRIRPGAARHGNRREIHRRRAGWQHDAPLIAQIARRPARAVRQGDVHGLGGAVDDRLADLGALGVGADEVADVLGGEVGIEAGDEHGRTHDLAIPAVWCSSASPGGGA